ncbi:MULTISPECIES: hypothetical protein [Acinetobacter Taxon 24D]|uniref:hypothetical protein n=1 Tax=Acinetobacter Taxon 24D TaxID=2839057 RepID=UPI00148FDA57|nr:MULTISPECIES: hypothetical protein [Acinetobacter Taxon 24D]NNG83104.1 hypothetical protein [Acinetobacter sp. ANC 5378]NNG99986.1 hypothetical protein [Acinetobacter sp. ANC 5414]
MLTSLRKQAWFVFLMVFAIGWSSVAFASVKPMHQQMMNEANVDYHPNAEITAMSGCYDSVSVEPHMQHSSEHVKAAHDQDCHQTMTDQQQHFSCNDCVHLHCQSLTVWLDSQISDLVHLEEAQEHLQRNFDYSAQHLTGFWQQILRPPKA